MDDNLPLEQFHKFEKKKHCIYSLPHTLVLNYNPFLQYSVSWSSIKSAPQELGGFGWILLRTQGAIIDIYSYAKWNGVWKSLW
jgi:hypothetical protein